MERKGLASSACEGGFWGKPSVWRSGLWEADLHLMLGFQSLSVQLS